MPKLRELILLILFQSRLNMTRPWSFYFCPDLNSLATCIASLGNFICIGLQLLIDIHTLHLYQPSSFTSFQSISTAASYPRDLASWTLVSTAAIHKLMCPPGFENLPIFQALLVFTFCSGHIPERLSHHNTAGSEPRTYQMNFPSSSPSLDLFAELQLGSEWLGTLEGSTGQQAVEGGSEGLLQRCIQSKYQFLKATLHLESITIGWSSGQTGEGNTP